MAAPDGDFLAVQRTGGGGLYPLVFGNEGLVAGKVRHGGLVVRHRLRVDEETGVETEFVADGLVELDPGVLKLPGGVKGALGNGLEVDVQKHAVLGDALKNPVCRDCGVETVLQLVAVRAQKQSLHDVGGGGSVLEPTVNADGRVFPVEIHVPQLTGEKAPRRRQNYYKSKDFFHGFSPVKYTF